MTSIGILIIIISTFGKGKNFAQLFYSKLTNTQRYASIVLLCLLAWLSV